MKHSIIGTVSLFGKVRKVIACYSRQLARLIARFLIRCVPVIAARLLCNTLLNAILSDPLVWIFILILLGL